MTLPDQSHAIEHRENNRNKKKMLQLLITGSESDDVDIALFWSKKYGKYWKLESTDT